MVQLAAGAFQFSRKLAVVAQLLDEQIVEQTGVRRFGIIQRVQYGLELAQLPQRHCGTEQKAAQQPSADVKPYGAVDGAQVFGVNGIGQANHGAGAKAGDATGNKQILLPIIPFDSRFISGEGEGGPVAAVLAQQRAVVPHEIKQAVIAPFFRGQKQVGQSAFPNQYIAGTAELSAGVDERLRDRQIGIRIIRAVQHNALCGQVKRLTRVLPCGPGVLGDIAVLQRARIKALISGKNAIRVDHKMVARKGDVAVSGVRHAVSKILKQCGSVERRHVVAHQRIVIAHGQQFVGIVVEQLVRGKPQVAEISFKGAHGSGELFGGVGELRFFSLLVHQAV